MDAEIGSFDAFVVAHGPALLRLAYLLTRDRTLAQDVVQDALVKTLRHWRRVQRADSPVAYVRRIVVNEVTGWSRRKERREWPGWTPETGLDDGADARADRDVVWQAVTRLPSRQRAVLVLRFYEGLGEDEIAAALGCARGTVRSLASRAYRTLRAEPGLRLDRQPTGER